MHANLAIMGSEVFSFKEVTIGNQPMICVYTEAYHYCPLELWQDTYKGQCLLEFLQQDQYRQHIKSVFFDNTALVNESSSSSFIEMMMECILNWTYTVDCPNIILEVTVCSHCMRLSSINFNSDNIPMYDHMQEKCISCLNVNIY